MVLPPRTDATGPGSSRSTFGLFAGRTRPPPSWRSLAKAARPPGRRGSRLRRRGGDRGRRTAGGPVLHQCRMRSPQPNGSPTTSGTYALGAKLVADGGVLDRGLRGDRHARSSSLAVSIGRAPLTRRRPAPPPDHLVEGEDEFIDVLAGEDEAAGGSSGRARSCPATLAEHRGAREGGYDGSSWTKSPRLHPFHSLRQAEAAASGSARLERPHQPSAEAARPRLACDGTDAGGPSSSSSSSRCSRATGMLSQVAGHDCRPEDPPAARPTEQDIDDFVSPSTSDRKAGAATRGGRGSPYERLEAR